ncbi:hypothetical protein FQN54_007002 [Arachnomyces sp. PD_36]|nr:hypothetical protein FQN54_007002 [Arachnomyces sp. PD_36]
MSPSIKNIAIALALASTATAKEIGCFGDAGSLKHQGQYVYESQAHCIDECSKLGNTVVGLTKGDVCYCGDEAPTSEPLPDGDCDTPCSGYPGVNCGGKDAWLVLTTGEEDSAVRTGRGKRDDDPTGEDEFNDADDASDNAEDTDGGNDDVDPTGEDEVNDADDASDNMEDMMNDPNHDMDDMDHDMDGGDDVDPTGEDEVNDADDASDNAEDDSTANNAAAEPSGTESGASPTETGAASHLSTGGVVSLVAFAAFALAI